MRHERCPTCRAILPPAKTCDECGSAFYRGEGGRTDATYCSAQCGGKARIRRWRDRHQQATEET